MNIGIVTVYNSINAGSYWQAYALNNTLRKFVGEDQTAFIYRNKRGSSASLRLLGEKVLRALSHLNFNLAMAHLRQYHQFAKAWKEAFHVTKDDTPYDCMVLGSDTIWNLEDSYFRKEYKTYWGERFSGKRLLAYAASIGNTDLSLLESLSFPAKCLARMEFISVRDEKSREAVKRLTGRAVDIVCDPTLHMSEEDYRARIPKVTPEKKYIFLYLARPLSGIQQSALRAFAKEQGLEIVNGIGTSNHSDRNVAVGPYSFLYYMANAEFVVTDKFHGAVFSTIFQRRFAAVERGKAKVTDFLGSLGLLDRITDDETPLSSVLTRQIDWEGVGALLEKQRNHSIDVLKRALDAVADLR